MEVAHEHAPARERLVAARGVGHAHQEKIGRRWEYRQAGQRTPVGLFGEARNTSAGLSSRMRAMKASASNEKSARSGTGTARIRENVAFMPYITKVGEGYISAAPGRASASVRIWIRSSEPLPSSSSMPVGTRILRLMSSRSARGFGSG